MTKCILSLRGLDHSTPTVKREWPAA